MEDEIKAFLKICVLLVLFLVLNLVNNNSYQTKALNVLPASRLLKILEDPTVYYVNQYGLKMPIPSAEVFLSYDSKWVYIETVEQAQLDFYKSAEYIKLIGDARVYQLANGVKRYLTPKAASVLKIFPEEVVPVNNTEFKKYVSGKTLDEIEATGLRQQKDALIVVNQQQEECVPDESVGGVNGCLVYEALKSKDISKCDDIESEEWSAKCYMSFISTSQDPEPDCENISNTNFANQCISQVALVKNSIEFCSKISNQEQSEYCKAGFKTLKKDVNACDSLPEGDGNFQKNICLFTYAQLNFDSQACEKISASSQYKLSCSEMINKQNALSKNLKPKFLATKSENIMAIIFGKKAQAQFSGFTDIPVGGTFLPGLVDIYTPSILCGLQVAVTGPRPGVFTWLPVAIYDYFPQNFYHVGLNMLGLAKFTPPCPPTLFMLGSSTFLSF